MGGGVDSALYMVMWLCTNLPDHLGQL